jgi:hypothetical protein
MENFKDIKGLFKKVLGSEVTVKDNIQVTEESVFCLFVEKLEQSHKLEMKLIDVAELDCNKVTDPLWLVIENLLKFVYGEEAANIIMWYIYDRFNPDGSIVPLEDEKGKTYLLSTPKDLWSYIKYRYPTK